MPGIKPGVTSGGKSSLPRCFDTPLPIDAVLDELARRCGRNAAVLVAPPGAGKTTRVPLALLDEPWATARRSSCWSRGGWRPAQR